MIWFAALLVASPLWVPTVVCGVLYYFGFLPDETGVARRRWHTKDDHVREEEEI